MDLHLKFASGFSREKDQFTPNMFVQLFKSKQYLGDSDQNNEYFTWKLFDKIISNDKYDHQVTFDKDHTNFINHQKIAQHLFSDNKDVKTQRIILDWLEEIYSEMNSVSTHNKPVSGIFGNPDKIFESKEKSISRDDNMRRVWELLRGGHMDEAIAYLKKTKQFVKAATLESSLLYNPDEKKGNMNRYLALKTIRQLSSLEEFDQYERSIYGVLCGEVNAIKLVTSNFYDKLWAELKGSLEGHINKEILSCMRRDGIYGIPKALDDVLHSTSRDRIESVFFSIQSDIASGQITRCISSLASSLAENPSERLSRFAAYFVLTCHYLYELDMNSETDDIFIAYIDHLQRNPTYYELIPKFVSKFSNQDVMVQVFADFVKDKDADLQKKCYEMAKPYKEIPIQRVQSRVMESLRQVTSIMISPNQSLLDKTTTFDYDDKKIQSLKYMCSQKSASDFTVAVQESSKLIVDFLMDDKYDPAKETFEQIKVPEDLDEIAWARYEEWKDYFTVMDKLRLLNDVLMSGKRITEDDLEVASSHLFEFLEIPDLFEKYDVELKQKLVPFLILAFLDVFSKCNCVDLCHTLCYYVICEKWRLFECFSSVEMVELTRLMVTIDL